MWTVNCRACNDDDDADDKKTIESFTRAVNASIYCFISGIANFNSSFHCFDIVICVFSYLVVIVGSILNFKKIIDIYILKNKVYGKILKIFFKI